MPGYPCCRRRVCTASFTATPTANLCEFAFTDTSPGSPTSWHWDFGDGATSTLQNPTHQYSTGVDHTVTLTLNGGECSTFQLVQCLQSGCGTCGPLPQSVAIIVAGTLADSAGSGNCGDCGAVLNTFIASRFSAACVWRYKSPQDSCRCPQNDHSRITVEAFVSPSGAGGLCSARVFLNGDGSDPGAENCGFVQVVGNAFKSTGGCRGTYVITSFSPNVRTGCTGVISSITVVV